MPNEIVRKRRQSRIADAKPPEAWVDREVADCEFKDERLGKRFRSLLEQLFSSPGDSIPLVCQDWANTKAAYRFLDNDRVSEAQILGGHFQATRDRAATIDGPVLVMHDTTEFTYTREDIDAVGKTRINVAGGRADRRPRYYTGCGLDPFRWTPQCLQRRSQKCRTRERSIQRNFAGKWSNWSGQAANSGTYPESSAQRIGPSENGLSRPSEMPSVAMAA